MIPEMISNFNFAFTSNNIIKIYEYRYGTDYTHRHNN